MRIRRNLILLLPILLLAVSTLFAQDATDKRKEDALKNVAVGKDALPTSSRTCFWSRGASSGDPYIQYDCITINIAPVAHFERDAATAVVNNLQLPKQDSYA